LVDDSLLLLFSGDADVEFAAIDHASMVYDRRSWDCDRLHYIKERININHRLWKAGQRSGLERFFLTEPLSRGQWLQDLPFDPEDLPGSSFAT
jgi:hypothetical protein